MRDPSRDYWTEVKKIHIYSSIQNKVDDKTGSVDIANAFADQYSILYSSVPTEPTYLSELLMYVKTSVRNICQHKYYYMKHCHFVNSTKISDVIKDCVLVSQTELIIYTQTILNMAHPIFPHCISVVINYILCHEYAPTSSLHAAVTPIPKNTKLNL